MLPSFKYHTRVFWPDSTYHVPWFDSHRLEDSRHGGKDQGGHVHFLFDRHKFGHLAGKLFQHPHLILKIHTYIYQQCSIHDTDLSCIKLYICILYITGWIRMMLITNREEGELYKLYTYTWEWKGWKLPNFNFTYTIAKTLISMRKSHYMWLQFKFDMHFFVRCKKIYLRT